MQLITYLMNVSGAASGCRPNSAANTDLEATLVKRMTPEYRVAFDAWLETDPFVHPAAPAGPGVMPQYKNPELEQAAKLNTTATATFDEGTTARETGEKYVRDTVLFAMVLFLGAIAQRMKDRNLRTSVNLIAAILAGYAIFSVGATTPTLNPAGTGPWPTRCQVLRAGSSAPVALTDPAAAASTPNN